MRDADAFRFDPASAPLETRVEREVVPLTLRLQTDGREFSDVLFAVRWGKRLLQMMKDAGIGGDYTLHGVSRMHERPIGDLVDALNAVGAQIEYAAHACRARPNLLGDPTCKQEPGMNAGVSTTP